MQTQLYFAHKRPTQAQKLLMALKARGHHGLFNYEAFEDLHILRLGSRIHDLRQDGHNIKIEKVKGKRGVFRYVLLPEVEYGDEG